VPKARDVLEARDVRLRRSGRLALDGASVTVAPGELVALCGPNGAGKSSLLAVLAGDLRPETSEARIDGEPVAALSPRALALRRAVLEQAPTLAAPFTVAELVALGAELAPLAADAAALTRAAMAAAGVAAFADRPATALSGGEQARCHLARALAQLAAGRAAGHGRWLLLDEPTASLDLAHQIAVLRAVRAEVDRGAGVLAVLHDLNLAAAFADRVALMAAGRVVADGPPAQVLTAEALSALYQSPIAVEQGRGGALRIVPDIAAA
jgi:iron complex transport system ATP-binding protein